MDDLNFKTKYLMYKAKYLSLKKNMNQNGGGNSKDDVILFKSKNCGHCIDFLPKWETLQKQFTGVHNFITYEASDVSKEKLEEFEIEGVPSLFRVSENRREEFRGERDLDSLIAFLS